MDNSNFFQPNIWEPKCPTCEVYDSCGGTDSAPCGCILNGKHRYNCSKCTILCRERCSEDNSDDIYTTHVNSCLKLEDLKIKHRYLKNKMYPIFIPSQTRQLPKNTKLAWAGVTLPDLINSNNKPPISTKKYLDSMSTLCKKLRLKNTNNIIAILNSQDKLLEHFWASDRKNLFILLKSLKFLAATGPTFSIYQFTELKQKIPDSHNVLMNMRQNKVLQEIYDSNIDPIPNIYRRNRRDDRLWIEWINKNSEIEAISRDFSSTRNHGPDYEKGLDSLIYIASKSNRRLHIFLNGISYNKAASVLNRFAEIGCTCSFITPHPIIIGRFGFKLKNRGVLVPEASKEDRSILGEDIALNNIYIMRDYIYKIALSTGIYPKSSYTDIF